MRLIELESALELHSISDDGGVWWVRGTHAMLVRPFSSETQYQERSPEWQIETALIIDLPPELEHEFAELAPADSDPDEWTEWLDQQILRYTDPNPDPHGPRRKFESRAEAAAALERTLRSGSAPAHELTF